MWFCCWHVLFLLLPGAFWRLRLGSAFTFGAGSSTRVFWFPPSFETTRSKKRPSTNFVCGVSHEFGGAWLWKGELAPTKVRRLATTLLNRIPADPASLCRARLAPSLPRACPDATRPICQRSPRPGEWPTDTLVSWICAPAIPWQWWCSPTLQVLEKKVPVSNIPFWMVSVQFQR